MWSILNFLVTHMQIAVSFVLYCKPFLYIYNYRTVHVLCDYVYNYILYSYLAISYKL